MFSGIKSVWGAVTSVLTRSKSNVAGETEPTKNFVDSDPVISEKLESNKRLADAVKEKSTLLEPQTGPLPVYKIPLKDEQINVAGCKRFSFGKESIKRNRTIMVLGATGAGKSTLINGMINYILGVEWEDSYRFKLVAEDQSISQAESQTSEVTTYKINHQEGFKTEYSLTIVDTPGFGDTRGIKRDKEITEQLRNLFSAKLGVSEIDAVCFVAQASLARLTPSQKYVFDSVLSIFGKDVAENIRVLVTFADGQLPPVLEAINVSGVPCPKTKDGLPIHFKFNNSALFAHNKSSAAESRNGDDEDDEDGGFDQMFWNMGTKSMKRFFVALNVIETKSLTMTKEVLRERNQLEDSVENLQKQVKLGLAKLEEIKETAEKLKEHEAEISRNENFEFEVTVTKPVQIDISGTGIFLTNCQQCHYTCHHNCAYANDKDKIHCGAMGSDGYCTQCPGKCFWNVHFNQKYKWEYEEVKEKRTVKELQEKYLNASKAKSPVQALIEKLSAEYDLVQAEVVKLMERSAKCLNRLKEIALKPNPLSTPEYIDMLIEGEKSEAKPGWNQRVQYLIAMREKAECMAKLDRGEKLLQCTPTDFWRCHQSQTKNNANQDKTDTNTSHNNTKTNTNRDQDNNDTYTDTRVNQDNTDNTNADQDKAETDTNQDKTEPSSDLDKDATGQDETKTDSNMTKDKDSELDTDPDQDETNSDTNEGQDSELDTDPDQDETNSDTNEGQDSEFDTDPDQDKTNSDTNKGQDSEFDTDPDQDKTNSDNNKDQDRVHTATQQD